MTVATPDLKLWTDWLTLAAIPQVGRKRLWQLVAALGTPEAVLRASPAALRAVEGVDEVTAQSIADHRDAIDLRADAQTLADLGGRLVSFLDADYPRLLRRMDDPPPIIFLRGDYRPLDEVAIAVVGSRNMTDYGRQMTETIAGELAAAGITIVSGFATGIDGVAHTAALDRGGRTVAVLGCGVDVLYPATHRRLRERILESGAMISTYPPGTAPRAEHFPDRNAILAALTQAVVVIEASEKSGALITAHHAVEQGRLVFAVPGDVTRANSSGVNRLIQEGAKLVTCAGDVLADMSGVLRGLLAELGGTVSFGDDTGGSDLAVSREVLESLSSEELELFTAIQAGPIQYDVLLRTVALSPERRQTLPMQLMNLQMSGLIDELPGKRFAARPAVASLSLERRAADSQAQDRIA